jgi:hypothetical protein
VTSLIIATGVRDFLLMEKRFVSGSRSGIKLKGGCVFLKLRLLLATWPHLIPDLRMWRLLTITIERR